MSTTPGGDSGHHPGAPLLVAGDRLFTSGLTAEHRGGVEAEAQAALEQAMAPLRDAGASPPDVLRTRFFYVPAGAEPLLRGLHGATFAGPGPAFSAVRVSHLPGGARVTVELEAVRGAGSRIRHHAPDPKTGTSLAVELDGEVWLSGMRAVDADGWLAGPPDLASQVRTAVARAEAALGALGASVADVVATRHFVRHDLQAESLPPEWGNFMKQGLPTAAGIAVEGVGPRDAAFLLEAEAVAGAARSRRNLRTGRTYEVEHHYCRAVRVAGRDVVYVAGTTSIVPGEIVQHPDQVGPQVHDALAIIRWAIEQHGLAWTDLARTRTYVVGGPAKLLEAIEALRQALGGLNAAATLVGVPVLGRPTVVVEIEAIAVHR